MSVYIPGNMIPTKCVGCIFRDPEYGGNCILMPSFDADTYEKQFDRCPFKELLHWFGVPPHGRTIDGDALIKVLKEKAKNPLSIETTAYSWAFAYEWLADVVGNMPTIIPADPDKEEER